VFSLLDEAIVLTIYPSYIAESAVGISHLNMDWFYLLFKITNVIFELMTSLMIK